MPTSASDALPRQGWATAIGEGRLPGGRVDERSAVRRYAVALLATVAALVLTLAFASWSGGAVFPVFFAAVVASAIYGGTAPGFLAMVLAGASVALFFPIQGSASVLPAELVRLGTFAAAALLVLTLLRAARVALHRAEQGEREARELAEQLQEQATELEHQIDQSQSLAQELEISAQELLESGDEARRARDEAEAAEHRYRALVDGLAVGVILMEKEAGIVASNPAAERILGLTRDQMRGRSTLDPRWRTIHADHSLFPGETHPVMISLSRGEPQANVVMGVHRPDDSLAWIEVSSRPLFRAGEPIPYAAVASFVDITERKQTAEALRASEQRHRMLFDSNPLPLWVFDQETLAFLAVNQAAIEHYGYTREDFLAMTIKDIRPTEDLEALRDALVAPGETDQLGPTMWGEFRHRRKDGTVIMAQVTTHPVIFSGRPAELVLALDVTDRKRVEEELRKSEEQLRHSQKLEAVGQLAGGVAHDFNNVLTAVKSYSEFLLEDMDTEDPRRADVVEIELAANRAAGLTRQLLAFGRKQLLEPQVLDLNAVVLDMEKMLRRLIGEDIDIRIVTAPDLGRVEADPGQVEQVVMNLAVNARDAMPGGGTLTIETGNVDLDERYADAHVAVEPGSYVVLTVTDDGCGIDRETQARIFEPFFTTKERGKGTGLGLSTVYGIVKQSGGYVWVYSDVGQGTTFRIYLPRVEGTAVTPERSAPGERVTSGSETVLVAEDEDMVRAVVARVLTQQGYTVLEARDGEEALCICREHVGPIHLILTDVIMPRVSGAQLAQESGVLRPEAKVLLMSGYTDGELERRGVVAERVAFLQKPFTPTALAQKVREVLE
jgi:two-component system cell cycle sensor histidine kinase/response regulator CckA